jgi:hypothetical protein
MARTPKLDDLQMILLSTASARTDASVFPLPDSISEASERVRNAVPALIKHALAAEKPVLDLTQMWREAEGERFGLFITDAGRSLIDGGPVDASNDMSDPVLTDQPPASSPALNKTEAVLELLNRAEGATSAELIEATGWLPHTVRAALTGLRKKGHAIERSKRGDQTCYRIQGKA